MKRYLSLSALSLAAVITLAGCGNDTEPATPVGSASESAQEGTGPSATTVSEEHNEADVMFAQMMIPHHLQAVDMSEIMLAKENISPEITELAKEIKAAQDPEVETMTSWLEAWGEPVEPESDMQGHDMDSMDGMMSDDQMAELENVEGKEASRMFLESMTEHHKGAIDMAQDEIGNGKNPEAIDLAETIVKTQQAEIEKMQELLAGL